GVIKAIAATPTLCLSGDTMIWHNALETKISDFNISNHVLALKDNKLMKIRPQKIQMLKNSLKLIKITSVSGRSIKITPNHKMFIKRNDKRDVLECKNVKLSDKIATVRKIDISSSKPLIGNFIEDNYSVNKNYEFDANLSYLIGSMLGDGYSGAEFNGKKIIYKGSPCIVGEDEEVFKIIENVCDSLELNYKKAKNHYETDYLRLSKCKWFREFLVRCGVDIGDKKHISEKLMGMEQSNISALLRGLFDTDGYVEKRRGPGFSNTSERLVKQVQKLLLRFGIVSSIRTKREGTMKIYDKEYNTKPHFELLIQEKRSIVNFQEIINFNIKRKQKALEKIVDKLNLNLKYVSCERCNYKIYKDIFSGRTKKQKEWGALKLDVIKFLGKKGELGSRELNVIIGGEPRKNSSRLNHHYELIKKRKKGKISKTEWYWNLNDIGKWIFNNIISKNKNIEDFLELNSCPICKMGLERVLKKGWRNSDFDGDIFWDKIRSIEYVKAEEDVYDVVIPDKPKNDHMFVANGFIVHNSWGVNLPAYRVIIRDLKRFSGGYGSDYIPVLEIEQMMGRAGRPKYDTEGEAILIAKDSSEAEYVYDTYITGEPEKIQSKLGVEPVLRMHTLALVASGITFSKEKLYDFFSKTFFAHQYGDMSLLEGKLENVISMLKDFGFVKGGKVQDNENPFRAASELSDSNEKLEATVIGKRISELYIDPITADYLITNLKRAGDYIHPFAMLQLISKTLEMRPSLSVRKKDVERIDDAIIDNEKTLIDKPPNEWDVNYDDYMRSIKTALFFSEWIDEIGEDMLLENFGVAPGELRTRLSNADWLLYSIQELSLLLGMKDIIKHIRKTRIRMKYGIREELLPFVKLKGVGRVRARTLYTSNIKSIADLKKIPIETLTKLTGPKTARNIKEQLNQLEKNT
ncbi:MAG: hypothetical protein KAS04_00150, partial [Candidatus Aenigmarchaeota archaeon]|nr:hypothetical protein [Candidatus Aenigmarchaeota archaeon]